MNGSAAGESSSEGYHSSSGGEKESLESDMQEILTRLDISDSLHDDFNETDLAMMEETSFTTLDYDDERASASTATHDNGIWCEDTRTEKEVKGETTGGERSEAGLQRDSSVKNTIKGFLRKLSTKGARSSSSSSKSSQNLDDVLAKVKVDKLPQTFVTKYLGCRPCRGVFGIQHTRRPVEELIEQVSNMKKGEDLALLQLHVSQRGILVHAHSKNKGEWAGDNGLLPIEFISYGVQDVKYTRIFSYIVVKELTSKSKKLECHCYVCDSAVTARRLAMSVALAFEEYSKTLEGKPYKFQVDLRPTKEVEKDLVPGSGSECEA